MDTITISPKYQIVIPKSVREQLELAPGQKVYVIAVGGRIEVLPVKPARELRGILRGLDYSLKRDEEERV